MKVDLLKGKGVIGITTNFSSGEARAIASMMRTIADVTVNKPLKGMKMPPKANVRQIAEATRNSWVNNLNSDDVTKLFDAVHSLRIFISKITDNCKSNQDLHIELFTFDDARNELEQAAMEVNESLERT